MEASVIPRVAHACRASVQVYFWVESAQKQVDSSYWWAPSGQLGTLREGAGCCIRLPKYVLKRCRYVATPLHYIFQRALYGPLDNGRVPEETCQFLSICRTEQLDSRGGSALSFFLHFCSECTFDLEHILICTCVWEWTCDDCSKGEISGLSLPV